MLQGKTPAAQTLLTSEVWASVSCHNEGKNEPRCPQSLLYLLFFITIHQVACHIQHFPFAFGQYALVVLNSRNLLILDC